MAGKCEAAYGSWKSPITAKRIAHGQVRFGQIVPDGENVYWTEQRPAEAGRTVIVCYGPDGKLNDMTPAAYNVRTRVHEYGGGAITVAEGVVYFVNDSDQRIYRQPPGEEPTPLTPEGPFRYADLTIDRGQTRLICVREDHTGTDEPVNSLVAIDLDTPDSGTILAEGNDFYSSPRLSPDGLHLVWLTWNHPNMPWDGTELWISSLREKRKVAGGADESIFQPEFLPSGDLVFVSDRTGWWNLFCFRQNRIEPLVPMEAEFGLPQWVFGMATYAVVDQNRIVCAYTRQGRWFLANLDPKTKAFHSIETPYTQIGSVQAAGGMVYFIGGSPTASSAIVQLDPETGQCRELRRSSREGFDAGYLSTPEAIAYPTSDGDTAHAFFYRPRNREFSGPASQRPPLIVVSHGGPTGASSDALKLMTQFWTSRGFAVLDVNYRGSTGYGRTYREKLNGQWGVADVEDCARGARWLADKDEVDPKRLIIRGSSAGGYTTLCALTFHDTFKAGGCYYGISDLEALAGDTHKFESRYTDRLVGAYPQCRDLYRSRSPIHFADRLSCPVIFFQGLEDKVVPPDQTETMVSALSEKGLPVEYIPFEGEQHGFRRAESICKALESELDFYRRCPYTGVIQNV